MYDIFGDGADYEYAMFSHQVPFRCSLSQNSCFSVPLTPPLSGI
jgi:hypothetical protein